MKVDYQKEAEGLIEGRVLFDAPMKRYTSLRVGGPADCLFFPKDLRDLKKIVQHARRKKIPLFILGNGTNLIVRDGGIRGWVVSLTQGLRKIQMDGAFLEVEAGCLLQQMVQYSMRKGLTGLEPFFGIPGTVGGGLVMNAGAWGAELKDVVHSITVMKEDGTLAERSRSRLRFSYRKLAIPMSWVIVKGRFRLSPGKSEEISERVKMFCEMRKKTQPLDYPSAGSVFKNPKEGPAGKWIDEVGLKGFRLGQAMVSERHANFIVNLGKATAEEILRLIEWVEQKVYEEKSVSLQREVKVVGES